ncbi:MAG: histidine phosphatase family protein [Acidimicrobiia bacterium]|nr:histidine phosphatase family protein [Acidimicrobiia bacterium]
MEVYLIRHAHSGARTSSSHDRYRQLSDDGSLQAAELVDFFAGRAVGGVHSSPATRCVQTVEPLAAALGLPVIEEPALWEDVGLDDVFDLIDSLTSDATAAGVVLCSHGNLIPAVIERLAAAGAEVHGRGCERASIWMIRSTEHRWVEARYFTPRSGYAG